MPAPAVYVRADANARIGWGHVVRTGVLAARLRQAGCAVTWLVRDSDAAAVRHLETRFKVVRLKREIVAGGRASLPGGVAPGSWLLVDRYGWGLRDQRALRGEGLRLLWMDDVGGAPFAADLVVNQNFGAEALSYRGDPGTRFLLGVRYVLLREVFRRRRPAAAPPRTRARRVLVTFGASDPRRMSARVLRALRDGGLDLRVVLGPSAPRVAGTFSHKVVRNATAGRMRQLMEWADVAVAAPGSTVWELSFLGVPSILVCTADNQRGIGERLAREGRAEYLGWHEDASDATMAERIRALLGDPAARGRLRRRAMSLVDGRGVDRILRAMGL